MSIHDSRKAADAAFQTTRECPADNKFAAISPPVDDSATETECPLAASLQAMAAQTLENIGAFLMILEKHHANRKRHYLLRDIVLRAV